jgi:hypothetical protein
VLTTIKSNSDRTSAINANLAQMDKLTADQLTLALFQSFKDQPVHASKYTTKPLINAKTAQLDNSLETVTLSKMVSVLSETRTVTIKAKSNSDRTNAMVANNAQPDKH